MFGPCAGILPDSKAWALSGVLLSRAWGGMSTSVFCCVHSLTAAAATEGPVAIPESLYNYKFPLSANGCLPSGGMPCTCNSG